MNGLLQPTTGSVEFERQRVSKDNVLELRRRMGYVIQDGVCSRILRRPKMLRLCQNILAPPLTRRNNA